MDNFEKNWLSQRPQSLCNMCGKCCRCSTTSYTYQQLLQLQAEGNQGAIDFLELFEPYESIEAARKVSTEVVDNIIKGLKEDGNYVEEDMTFYHCRFIGDDNLCTRYLERKTLCDHFPASPWAIVPPGCGFEGWLFMKREEKKQQIRKTKEDLLELQLLKNKTTDPETISKIEAVENKMHKTIEKFEKYGAKDW